MSKKFLVELDEDRAYVLSRFRATMSKTYRVEAIRILIDLLFPGGKKDKKTRQLTLISVSNNGIAYTKENSVISVDKDSGVQSMTITIHFDRDNGVSINKNVLSNENALDL